MAVGDEAKSAVPSYIGMFLETTWGTNPSTAGTNATAIEALSIGFKTNIKSEKLETLNRFRGYTKRVQLDKEVTGAMEQYFHPIESVRLFAVTLGGGIVSASMSGGFVHSISAGNFDTNNSSVAFNVRKGDTHVFGYTGGRVNSMKLTGAVGEVIKVAYDFIFKDSTQGITDIGSGLSISSVLPFTYVQGVYRYKDTETSIDTTTSEEPITAFELTIINNLKSDKDARELGSNVLSVLPATRRAVEFKITQRFDTTTTYNRFIQGTIGSVELNFVGGSMGTAASYQCVVRLPRVYMNSTDPEIKSAKDLLMSEIAFDVISDNPNTSTGRDIGVTFMNTVANYTA